jgi:hypothetical protein
MRSSLILEADKQLVWQSGKPRDFAIAVRLFVSFLELVRRSSIASVPAVTSQDSASARPRTVKHILQ